MGNAKLPPPADYDDNPEWTEEMFQAAKPAPDALPPEIFQRLRGRPKAETVKELVSMRLDPDVLAYYRASGSGWQTRINSVLRAEMARKQKA